ncbi:MAG: hypothetical protein QM698_11790 [Micropepsaceae bacterium]
MRILTAFGFALALLLSPSLAAAEGGKCDKPVSEMTPDEYVDCVSVGGVKTLIPAAPQDDGAGRSFESGAPQAAGRGVTAAGASEGEACNKAKARAGGNGRGSCTCSQKSAGRYECTIATANVIGD